MSEPDLSPPHDEAGSRGVAIVGGGAAGTFMALALAQRGLSSTIFDRRGAFGRGLAYGATAPWHRINVPIDKIGRAFPGETKSFVAWYAESYPAFGPEYGERFVPRGALGTWLRAELDERVRSGQVRCEAADIVRVVPGEAGLTVLTGAGARWEASHVVLCLGTASPARLAGMPEEGYVPDIWAPAAFDPIPSDAEILIVGTGATAIDAVLELRGRRHRGTIRMLSRRGLMPLVDVEPRAYATHLDFRTPRPLRALVAALRAEARRGAEQGFSWQHVVDGFRGDLATIWASMTEADRKRFHRHVRPVWLVHRHRLAPDIVLRLAEERAAGSLEVIRGRLRSVRREAGQAAVRIAEGAAERELRPGWILNCTGPSESILASRDPLLRSLVADGTIRPGELGIGIDVDETCRCLRPDGSVQERLCVVGSATRMRFGEVTSAPQIRDQAGLAATALAARAGALQHRARAEAARPLAGR